jgi:hypothetical protein
MSSGAVRSADWPRPSRLGVLWTKRQAVAGRRTWLCIAVLGALLSTPASAEVTDACRSLATEFVTAPERLDAQSLVTLSQCVTTELGARASTPAAEAPPGGEGQSAAPPAPGPVAPPPPIPANVFPSAPVPSPEITSPVIVPPDQTAWVPAPQSATSDPARSWGQWAAPYPWGQWPAPDNGFR